MAFNAPVYITQYRLWAIGGGASHKDAPIDWTLQGSNDGTTWSVVDARVNSEPPDTATVSGFIGGIIPNINYSIPHGKYTVSTPGLFSSYRLHATKTGGGSNRNSILRVMELELLGM